MKASNNVSNIGKNSGRTPHKEYLAEMSNPELKETSIRVDYINRMASSLTYYLSCLPDLNAWRKLMKERKAD
jgi:hypothetical protein